MQANTPDYSEQTIGAHTTQVSSLSSSRREARFFDDEVLPVLKLSNLEQLELHVGRIVLRVYHIQGLVAVDPIK